MWEKMKLKKRKRTRKLRSKNLRKDNKKSKLMKRNLHQLAIAKNHNVWSYIVIVFVKVGYVLQNVDVLTVTIVHLFKRNVAMLCFFFYKKIHKFSEAESKTNSMWKDATVKNQVVWKSTVNVSKQVCHVVYIVNVNNAKTEIINIKNNKMEKIKGNLSSIFSMSFEFFSFLSFILYHIKIC